MKGGRGDMKSTDLGPAGEGNDGSERGSYKLLLLLLLLLDLSS